ncbi:MAG: histidine kinase [Specibacter sp.]
MTRKLLPPGRAWRTVLLVLGVAAADVLFSLIVLGLGPADGTMPSDPTVAEFARVGIAPILAPLGAVALIWRHRFPKTVAAATAVLGALSFSCIGFMIALSIGAEARLGGEPLGWDVALVAAVLLAGIAGWGAYRGQRARLLESRLVSLRERAERAQAQRVGEIHRSKLAERQRIAREMHDILAHRMSLVAVQAAALQLDAPTPRRPSPPG